MSTDLIPTDPDCSHQILLGLLLMQALSLTVYWPFVWGSPSNDTSSKRFERPPEFTETSTFLLLGYKST